MAGNRLQKIGSVFSRTRNLLRIGVIEKPLWFDVYSAFPPLREPVYRVPRPRYGKVKDVIPPIFYPEDQVRAFVEKYRELKEEGKIEEEKLFEETGKALLASGIILQRRGTDKVAQQDYQEVETRASALHLQLQTVLEEMQEKMTDQAKQDQPQALAEAQKENLSSS